VTHPQHVHTTVLSSPVDPCSPARHASLSTLLGSSVPNIRVSLRGGPHSSPGCLGVSLGRWQRRLALIIAFFGPSPHPRKLVPRHDDSAVDSLACPYAVVLDGIPSWILTGVQATRHPRRCEAHHRRAQHAPLLRGARRRAGRAAIGHLEAIPTSTKPSRREVRAQHASRTVLMNTWLHRLTDVRLPEQIIG
jgi:hypothetical protein